MDKETNEQEPFEEDFSIEQWQHLLKVNRCIEVAKEDLLAKRVKEAKQILQYILHSLDKDNLDALQLFAVVALAEENYGVAISILNKVIAKRPDVSFFYINLGNAYQKQGKIAEALQAYQKAVEIDPSLIEAHANINTILVRQGKLYEALQGLIKAFEMSPETVETYYKIGDVFHCQGRTVDALQWYLKGFKLRPHHPIAHSNILMQMLPHHDQEGEELLRAHVLWDNCYAEPLHSKQWKHTNVPDPNRPLRIGYVSPDFRSHSAAFFIEPLLRQHQKPFSIYCYSNVIVEDEQTKLFQSFCHHWRNIRGLGDEEIAALIHKDQIDILIDLAGHTADNKLLVFAYKPAPIQMTYLGYAATTGMSSIDYRITDHWADPIGYEKHYSEKLLRLPTGFLCYQPPAYEDIFQESICSKKEFIIFGCFNSLHKINPEVIHLWAQILLQVADSKLFLKNQAFQCPQTRGYYFSLFAKEHIAADRLIFYPPLDMKQHLQIYNIIDIALDPFPYNGTTTSCDALWMGVPLVTIAGKMHVSRVGVSMLSRLGLQDFIAETPQQYIDIAVNLAQDPDRRKYLRTEIRKRMQESSLGNASLFIEQLEAAYRQVWKEWCAQAAVTCS